jgi:hypothetical protein
MSLLQSIASSAAGRWGMSFFAGIVFGGLFALVIADLEYRSYKRSNYQHFKKLAAQGFFKDLTNKNCCQHLAQKLEIQADGGDDPAEFVKWAIDECWRDADNGRVISRERKTIRAAIGEK